jgi:hypothetical protein
MPAASTSTASFARQRIVSRKACGQHGAQGNPEGLRSHRSCLLVVRFVEGRSRDREDALIDSVSAPSRQQPTAVYNDSSSKPAPRAGLLLLTLFHGNFSE